jgi:cyanate permease
MGRASAKRGATPMKTGWIKLELPLERRLSSLGLGVVLGVVAGAIYYGRLVFLSEGQAFRSLGYLSEPFSRVRLWLGAVVALLILLVPNAPLNRFARRMFVVGAVYCASMGCISEFFSASAVRWARVAVAISSVAALAASIALVVIEYRSSSPGK